MKCIKKLLTWDCPICRQSFNKNKIQNVNIIVRNTISQLFPQEYIERKTNSLLEPEEENNETIINVDSSEDEQDEIYDDDDEEEEINIHTPIANIPIRFQKILKSAKMSIEIMLLCIIPLLFIEHPPYRLFFALFYTRLIIELTLYFTLF
jgi:hypothetical protein